MMSPGVIGRSTPFASVHVPASRRSISARISLASSSDEVELPACADGQVPETRPERAPLGLAALGRAQAALVERVGDVAADVRVHPEGALEEEAHVLGDGRPLTEEVREHRAPGVAGMDALRHLRELHGVAEQDERLARTSRARARPRARSGPPRRRRGSRASRRAPRA